MDTTTTTTTTEAVTPDAYYDKSNRHHLLKWFNTLMKTNFTDVVQTNSGACHCQLMDWLFPGSIDVSSVKFQANGEEDYKHNFTMLQEAFRSRSVTKDVPVEELVKGDFKTNLHFLKWFKAFFTENLKNQEYDVVAARNGQDINPTGFMRPPKAPKAQIRKRDTDTEEDESNYRLKKVQKIPYDPSWKEVCYWAEPSPKGAHNTYCSVCKCHLSTAHKGLYDVRRHEESNKHRMRSQKGKSGAPRPAREPGAPRPAREAEAPLPCSQAAIQFILKHCYSGSEVSEQASRHYPRYMLGLHYPKDIMVACRRTPYSLYVYGGVTLGAAYGVSVVLVGYFDAKASRYSVRLLDAIRDVAGETAPAVAEVIKRFDLQPANLIAVYSEGSTPAASEHMCSALRELNPHTVALAGLYNLVEPACRVAVKQLTMSGVQVEELMADIHAHYSSASTKDDNLKALFTSSGDNVQSPPDPSNTSCLDPSNTSSLNLCRMVTKLVGMWNELESYFGSYADDDKAKAIRSRLQDNKLRETFNFLDYAMEPLHAFHKHLQPQDGNPKADLACILEEAGRMLHTYARRLLQPEAVSRYLEWSDAQILRDKASQLTGPRHVTSVYEALACIVAESLPLSFAALKSMAQLLNPYKTLDVSGEAVRELGTRLGLCKTPGEACALSIEFLEFHNLKKIEIQRDKSAPVSLEQRWANVLKDTESTSVLRKLLLGLMSLPCPPLEATSLFGQAVQNGDALLYSGRPETESEVGTTTGGEESDSTSGSSVVIVTSPQRTKKHQNNSDGNCLNGSTKPCEIRLTKIKSPNGSDNDTSGKDEGPTRGGFGWETSLRQKPPARTVFQAGKGTWDRPVDPEQENGKKEEPVKDTSVKSTTRGRPSRQSRYQDGHGFQAAELVWGKLKLKKAWAWWPGMITPWPRATPPPGFRRVEWFGDGLFSEMHIYAILPLADFNKCFSKTDFEDVPLYKDAIYQILELAAQRSSKLFSEAEHNKDKELQCMVAWATGGFLPGGPSAFTPAAVSTGGTDAPKILPDDSDSDFQPVPLKRKYNVVKDNVKTKNRSSISFSREGMMEHVVKNRKKLEDFCLSCGSPEIEVYHPLFEGNICLKCKENFIETLYRYDEDGYQSYCTVCCSGKEVILCGIASCCRCFCKDCLDILVAPETFDKLKDIDPWSCFMCDPTQCGGGGHLKRRDDWSTKVQQFFTNNSAFAFEPHRVYPSIPAQQRRPLKVLSLFDGIATGYLTLKQLGFKIERYIASEICEDSIAVGMVKHNGEIEHVNDVRTITRKHLAEWGPFDLLIGGSPCNDLSMVNPLRKGLFEGTGRLFFEFYRILTMLRPKDDDDRPFFWLFENVVFMAANDKSDICRFLECNPTFIDAVKVSPAHRARYFWGNLPGMNRPLATSLDDKVNLQDCLEIGRVAKFDKVRTITTKSNSIRQGKMGLPVTMNNKEDYLWCTEMEQIFGFPKHYTDVNNMGKNQRQKVLGRSWSVPVIRHLFAPLKDYFECQSVN